MIKLGLCCSMAQARQAVEAGFDYIELPVAELSEPAKADLPLYSTNQFFMPGMGLELQGHAAALDHAQAMFAKAAPRGIRLMVIGSGQFRRTSGDPFAGLVSFCELVGQMIPLAAEHGITLAPESLRRQETNVGNNPVELVAELRRVNPAAEYTADLYHHLAEGFLELPGRPAHVHLANRTRNIPEPDDSEVIDFLRQLARLGYAGGISYEGHWQPEDLTHLLDNLRLLVSQYAYAAD